MKKFFVVFLSFILLVGMISCDGSVDKKIFSRCQHTYQVQTNGTWKCIKCGQIYEYTDGPYFAFAEKGQITKIYPLTSQFSDTLCNLSYAGNLVRFKDETNIHEIYVKTVSGQSLIIKADKSIVHQYGEADYTEIQAVAKDSFHLWGLVRDFVAMSGNIVIEKAAKIEDFAVAKNAPNNGGDLSITISDKNSIGVLAYYETQKEQVKVNGTNAKDVVAANVTKNGEVVSIPSGKQARIRTDLYDTVQAAQAIQPESPVRIVNDTSLTSNNDVNQDNLLKIGTGVNVEISSAVKIESLGELENHGVISNNSVIKNSGKILNFGEINTSGSDSNLESKSQVENYGSIEASGNGKLETTGTNSKIENYGNINVESGSKMEISGTVSNGLTGEINNAGTITNNGTIEDSGIISNSGSGKIEGNTFEPSEESAVAQIVGGKKFLTVEAAITSSTDGDTIQLLKDLSLQSSSSAPGILISKNVIIDGNEKTITITGDGTYVFNNAGFVVNGNNNSTSGFEVNVKNLVVNCLNVRDAFSCAGGNNLDVGDITLSLDNVTVTNNGKGVYAQEKCAIKLNNCSIDCTSATSVNHNSAVIHSSSEGKVTVTGGTYKGRVVIWTGYDSSSSNPCGTITVESGTFIAQTNTANPVYAIYCDGANNKNADGGRINISGGSFSGRIGGAKNKYASGDNKNGLVSISGGTFTDFGFDSGYVTSRSITGGTFTTDTSAYVPFDYHVKKVDSNYYVEKCLLDNHRCSICKNYYYEENKIANNGVYWIEDAADLEAKLGLVANGDLVNPILYCYKNQYQFSHEIYTVLSSKKVTIVGRGCDSTTFLGYNVTTGDPDCMYYKLLGTTTVEVKGIKFKDFARYDSSGNPIVGDSGHDYYGQGIYIGKYSDSTTSLEVNDCRFEGLGGRSFLTVCNGSATIKDCIFDATDRYFSAINLLEITGGKDFTVENCTFINATNANPNWGSTCIAVMEGFWAEGASVNIDKCTFICADDYCVDCDMVFLPGKTDGSVAAPIPTVTNTVCTSCTDALTTFVSQLCDSVPEGFEFDYVRKTYNNRFEFIHNYKNELGLWSATCWNCASSTISSLNTGSSPENAHPITIKDATVTVTGTIVVNEAYILGKTNTAQLIIGQDCVVQGAKLNFYKNGTAFNSAAEVESGTYTWSTTNERWEKNDD